jgi:hypothetical protein
MLDLVVDLAAELLGDFVVESFFAGLIRQSKQRRQQTQSNFGLI